MHLENPGSGQLRISWSMPSPLVVVGIEPDSTDALHVGLTPAVEAAIDKAVAEGVRGLRELAMSNESASSR